MELIRKIVYKGKRVLFSVYFPSPDSEPAQACSRRGAGELAGKPPLLFSIIRNY